MPDQSVVVGWRGNLPLINGLLAIADYDDVAGFVNENQIVSTGMGKREARSAVDSGRGFPIPRLPA